MSGIIADTHVVTAIQAGVPVQTYTFDGHLYADRPVHIPPAEPTCKPLQATSLDAIADYIKAEWGEDHPPLIVYIESATSVVLLSQLAGRHQQRQVYLTADCASYSGGWASHRNEFADSESFTIRLLSQFEPTGDHAEVVRLVGNLRGEEVTEATDDGYSQTVTTRKGISGLQHTDAPSIVSLAPYRTFREIAQPLGRFLLRFRQAKDSPPKVGLFAADGNGWELAAKEVIKTYLEEHLLQNKLNVPVIK